MLTDGYGRHTPVLAGLKITRALSIDSALIPHVSDAIAAITSSWHWVEVGDSVADVVQECEAAIMSWYSAMGVGQVSMFLGALPSGWLALDGATYDEVDYPELYSQLDAQYVNDVAETFTLPDLVNLFPVVAGDSYNLGDGGGVVDVALTVAELPAHTHNYQQVIMDVDVKTVGVPDPFGARLGAMIPTSSTGSDAAHENLPPYYALIFGIFAGRA